MAQSKFEECIYFKQVDKLLLIVALCVDDFLIFSNSDQMKDDVKCVLTNNFKIKDLGEVKHFLGLNIVHDRTRNKIKIDQKQYILNLLEKFNLTDAKTVSTPMEKGLQLKPNPHMKEDVKFQNLIGSLMYLTVHTRPDIAFSIHYLSQFNTCHDTEHFKHAKRILRYLKGTIDKCLTFTKSNPIISCFVDADFSNDIMDRKSYTGFVFKMCGGSISWGGEKAKMCSFIKH